MPIDPKSFPCPAEEFFPDTRTRTGQSRLTNASGRLYTAGMPSGALHSIEIPVTDGAGR